MSSFFIYLLKVSGGQLLAFLGSRYLLEKEPWGLFKRIYLLLGLSLPFLLPFWVVRSVYLPAETVSMPLALPLAPMVVSPTELPQVAWSLIPMLLVFLYVAGCSFGLIRLVNSLCAVRQQIKGAQSVSYDHGVRWVALPTAVSPNTFGPWIFHTADIPLSPAIQAHELAHARQWHTADRILVALVRAVCWFNPLLRWYEKAISHNHELLADQAALQKTGISVTNYQRFLLQSLSNTTPAVALSSSLSYPLLKQRFLMLRTHPTPPQRILGKIALLVLLWTGLFLGFDKVSYAQSTPEPPESTVPAPPP
ncbi:MAG: M56 family metallopeptidase, partial [Bacteroidota bacterium]